MMVSNMQPRFRMDTSTPVFPSLRLGTVAALTAAAGCSGSGEGPGHAAPGHGEAGESDGLHELPSGQVCIFLLPFMTAASPWDDG